MNVCNLKLNISNPLLPISSAVAHNQATKQPSMPPRKICFSLASVQCSLPSALPSAQNHRTHARAQRDGGATGRRGRSDGGTRAPVLVRNPERIASDRIGSGWIGLGSIGGDELQPRVRVPPAPARPPVVAGRQLLPARGLQETHPAAHHANGEQGEQREERYEGIAKHDAMRARKEREKAWGQKKKEMALHVPCTDWCPYK